jgi:rhamnogalacturonan endolyase
LNGNLKLTIIVSNHHGANAPNITAGFDRTFGPAFYYFNHGARNSTLAELRRDATRYADPEWGQPFYDAVAPFVSGYISPSKRGKFRGKLSLPKEAKNAIAILSASEIDVQDNAASPNSYQYWSKINSEGEVTIPMVVPGIYRMTIQAAGVFGEYIQDNIEITGGKSTPTNAVTASWKEESHGQEAWRIGMPDQSAGDYRHGFAKDKAHPRAPEEYRIFWGAYDFQKDFPSGVRFKVGESVEGRDWNYVHWSEFNGRGGGNVSDWRVIWSQGNQTQTQGSKATLTIQLAGVKTASGNSHILENGKPWPDLPFTVLVNNQQIDVWDIP